MATTQADLIMEYFKAYPNRPIKHPEIVDWVTEEYKKRTGNVFRDPDRAIRKLHQQGILQKISKGVYLYDPEVATNHKLEDFTLEQKKIIFERDGYCCVICGKGPKDGIEIHVDHIKPKDKGGKAIIENGQTLCSIHNLRKKNYDQTESGKRMFIRLLDLAKKEQDELMMNFCQAILQVYDEYGINGHIDWR